MDAILTLCYILLFPGFVFLLILSFGFEFLDRRIAARMQHRVGPPFFQPFADFVKLLGKEVIDPAGIDRHLFDAIPLLTLAAVMTASLYLPLTGASPFSFPGDLILILFLLTVPTIALFLLGWLNRNAYAAMGGIRAVTMLFIYEVPLFIALLMPALMAGSWSVSDIVVWQQTNTWLILLQPIGFVVAIISLQAKLERTPFDIPEAETEIIAGPLTELTGRRLALMHLAKDLSLVTGCALITVLFLGGPTASLVSGMAPPGILPGAIILLIKMLAVLLLLAAIRVGTGRIRIDQLNTLGWKYLAGAAVVQVALVLIMNSWWVKP